MDVHIEHMDAAIDFLLFGPFDVWVNAVDVSEECVCVVIVDGYERIVGLTKPKEDGVRVGKGLQRILLEPFHVQV